MQTNPKHRALGVTLCITICASLSGCEASEEDIQDAIRDANAERFAVQVCIPGRTTFLDPLAVDVSQVPPGLDDGRRLGLYKKARDKPKTQWPPLPPIPARPAPAPVFETIRQWRPPVGAQDFPVATISLGTVYFSAGKRRAERQEVGLVDTTETDQPVFFRYPAEYPGRIAAVDATLPVLRDGRSRLMRFWFRLPTDLPRGAYTDWLPAVAEEAVDDADAPVSWILQAGHDLPQTPAGRDAPKARFTQFTKRDFIRSTRPGQRAMDAYTLQQIRGDLRFDTSTLHLAPLPQGPVPSCG